MAFIQDVAHIAARGLLLFQTAVLHLFPMMISSLWRIPCILISTSAFHKATTPPQPAPTAKENAPSTSLEIILKQRSGRFIVQVICWSAALAEIGSILASKAPNLPYSQSVLLGLCTAGRPQNIRPTLLFCLGTLMMSFGGYIRWSCYRALGRLFTFEMSIRDNHRLVVDGPYSVVRHPAYTGILLTVIGVIVLHASPGSWARECEVFYTKIGQIAVLAYLSVVVLITVGLILRMSKEDAALKVIFGKMWDDWARRVPDKLLPWVY